MKKRHFINPDSFRCFGRLMGAFLALSVQLWASVSSSTGNLDFYLNDNIMMRLDSNGLGIGTTSPSTNLQVQGNVLITQGLSVGGSSLGSSNLHVHGTLGFGLQTVTTSTNLSTHSMVLADPVSGAANMVLNLPYAGNVEGQIFTIKQISTGNTITLQSLGSTIDGQPFQVSSGNSMGQIRLTSSANQWYILNASSDWSTGTLSNISGLSMWYDAADLDGDGVEEGSSESSYSTATGGNVVQWHDKSGNNYHLSGNVGKTTPAYLQETQNGRAVVTNSSNMLIHNGSIPDMDAWSVFVVAKPTVWGQNGSYIITCDDNRNSLIFNSAGVIDTVNVSNRGFFSTSQVYEVDGVTTANLTLNAYNHIYAEAHSSHAARNIFYLLARHDGNRSFTGSIAEVIFFNRTLSVDERRIVEGYLKFKWNLNNLID